MGEADNFIIGDGIDASREIDAAFVIESQRDKSDRRRSLLLLVIVPEDE